MSKITFTGLALLLILFLGNNPGNSAAQSTQHTVASAVPSGQALQQSYSEVTALGTAHATAPSGTLQKMIVENGSVTMELDLNRLNGLPFASRKLTRLDFAAAANSFFPILVFNNVLRGPEVGSISLVPAGGVNASIVAGIGGAGVTAPGYSLPLRLRAALNQLVLEKLPPDAASDLAVRDRNTGFTFFNIEGQQYDYDAAAKSLAISGGRLLISKELADAMGRPSDAGAEAGTISVGAVMQPIEITQVANGQPQSMVMPPLQHAVDSAVPSLVPGPDVIVGNIQDVSQMGSAGTQVGLAIGTDSCNNGDQPVDWFALPNTDHPVVPQNLYRMSGGSDNTERFEQVGHSWMKHTFEALEGGVCGTCNTSGCVTGTHLCPGCSDPYVSSLNGDQNGIGSRAWINPFTGSFPSGANNHSGHVHDGVSHRIRVEASDLNTTLNPNATYFGEAAYITPHEYTWCQNHPGQCNMYNNVSYRQFHVTGTTNFTFTAVGSTVRMQPAIQAWAGTGATVSQVEPDPGNDGIFFVGYKVTNPSAGVWHYDYAIYDENLDRAIQSFSVPVGQGVNISNIAFHAPPQEPGWANDGTFNNQGYSSTPWNVTQDASSINWSTETLVQNQNANAIRWGTLYNFRFDADQPPHTTSATVGFFKTGAPMPVVVQAPVLADATPTPTPTASPSVTPSPTPTPTPTATATPCDTGIIQNEGFETGSFPPWIIDGTNNPPVVTTDQAHSGTHSALAGNVSGPEPTGDSSFYQQFTVPAGGGTLSFYHWDYTTDSIAFDWQDAYITDANGNILQTIFHQCEGGQTWTNQQVDMAPYAGQTVRIKFLVHQDGFGDDTGMYVDDVILYQPCGTPSPTATATATATSTPTATFTPPPSPTVTPSNTPTPTATATATATSSPPPSPTPTATITATPTSTPRPTPTPRGTPIARPRPTPAPRP